MASQFSVDLEHLDQIVSRLSGPAGFIADHLTDIEHRVAALQGTCWEGVAARAYDDATANGLVAQKNSPKASRI